MSATIETAHFFNEPDQEIDQAEGPETCPALYVVEADKSEELAKELEECRETTRWLAESVGLSSKRASVLERWIVDGIRQEKSQDFNEARKAIRPLVEAKLEGTVQTEEEKMFEGSHAMLNVLLRYRLLPEPYVKVQDLEETRRALDVEFGSDGPVSMLEVVRLQHLAMRTLAEAAAETRNETDEQPADAEPSPVAEEAPAEAQEPPAGPVVWLRASNLTLPSSSTAEEVQDGRTDRHIPAKGSDGVAESVPTIEYDPYGDDQDIDPPDTLHSIDGMGEVGGIDGKVMPIAARKGPDGRTTRKRKPETTEQTSDGATTNSKSRQPSHNKLGDHLKRAPQPWANQAKCQKVEPDTFFPEKGGSVRAAKLICSLCVVRQECLDFALEHDERFGVWGGLTERERRKIRRM